MQQERDTGKHGITEERNTGTTFNAENENENALNFADTARATGIQRGTVMWRM